MPGIDPGVIRRNYQKTRERRLSMAQQRTFSPRSPEDLGAICRDVAQHHTAESYQIAPWTKEVDAWEADSMAPLREVYPDVSSALAATVEWVLAHGSEHPEIGGITIIPTGAPALPFDYDLLDRVRIGIRRDGAVPHIRISSVEYAQVDGAGRGYIASIRIDDAAEGS